MLTGIITKVHDDRSGFVKAQSGARYRFYPNHLWNFAKAAPKVGDEVVFEVNTTGRAAKGLRRLKGPGTGVVSEQRWVPSRIISKGVAINRYASTLYLTVAQVATNRLEVGAVVLVRQKHTLQRLAEVLELQLIPAEEATEMAVALQAIEAEAAKGLREAEARLLALGMLETTEQLGMALTWLKNRDAYGSAAAKAALEATPEMAKQLIAMGYGNWLSANTMLALRQFEEPNLRADQLLGALFDHYVVKRLAELGSVQTDEEGEEVLMLHQLSKQKGSKVFTAELLQNWELTEACQLGLWQQGLAIALPHTRFNPEPLPIGLFEQYVRQRLVELNPIETEEAEQELLRLVTISQQKHSAIFTAAVLTTLSKSEACQLVLWQQGAKVDLPHTRFDPSSLTGGMLDQYVRRRMAELNPIKTEEGCEEVLKLYLLSKQQHLNIFTSNFLIGLGMDEACQFKLWQAGVAVALPHTQVDPQGLISSQFQEYARLRIAELNPIESATAAQELLALYELSKWKQSVMQFVALLGTVSVADNHRLSLWQAGIDVFLPSTDELVQLVRARLDAGGERNDVLQLLTRCERHGVAGAVATEVLVHTADENLLAVLNQLQFPQMSAAYEAQLATVIETRSTEEQLLKWWLDGTVRMTPARLVARRILDLEGEEQLVWLRKFREQEGSSLAMVAELQQQMRKGEMEPTASLLLEQQVAIVRTQGGSNWYVDYWALAVVQGLAGEVVRLPALEQVEWWLRGLGPEPTTSVLREAAFQLPDNTLSSMWKNLSTPSVKALVPAILPGLERRETGRWVLLTLTELKARRGAFYSMACSWICAKTLPYLTAKEQVDLWIGGFISQPTDETIRPLMQSGVETITPILRKLSADSLVKLLPASLNALTIESPQTMVVLEQLTKHESWHAACAALKQELLAQLLPSVSDALYLEWWKSGWVPSPQIEQLSRSLSGLPSEQREALLRRCNIDLLVEYGDCVLSQPLQDDKLAEEVAMQLHSAGSATQEAILLLAELLLALQPQAHVLGWLNGKLPGPSANILERALGEMRAELCQKALDRCSVSLLVEYGQLLLQKPELEEGLVQPVFSRLAGFSNGPGVQQLVADLLAQVSPAMQLRCWLDVEVKIDWELILLGLEQENRALQLEVAHAAATRHLPELLHYLPAASTELLAQLVEVFTHEDSWKWGQSYEDRCQTMLALTEQLCLRFGQQTDLLQGYLHRVRKHCMSTKWSNYNHRNEPFANSAIVELLVEELVIPTLTVEQQLSYWLAGLLGYFPLVPLRAIAHLVATTPKAQWYPRLRTEAGLPTELLFAWEALSSLAAQSEQELEEIAAAHSNTTHQGELLRAIAPWLHDTLAVEQVERLWMWGYPVSEPRNWTRLTVLERIFTVIRFNHLNRIADLPPNFLPTSGEIWEWLAEQYWEAEQQQDVSKAFELLQQYHKLALVEQPAWAELEDELLLRCEAVVRVRLWLNQLGLDRERTFNYYGFRRGYSRLLKAEQRKFLLVAQNHLTSSFTKSLHLRRRRLLSKENRVSIYRVSLAHCYCPQEGFLEIELADNMHTQPFAYPEAKVEWNEKFLLEPWAGCPILAYVDGQSRELLQLKGLEAALIWYPPAQDPAVVFKRKRKKAGSTDNPVAYPQDAVLHDELTEYLTTLAGDAEQRAVPIEEARVKREARTPVFNGEADAIGSGYDDGADIDGAMLQPRQTVLYPVILQEEVVFVWASRFANSNQATYLFRAPAQEKKVALERLTTVLQLVAKIRSALLAPGRVSHRLRRHLGYVSNIRGKRGHDQAFKHWQVRLDKALEDGPSFTHPYDLASDWQMSELEISQTEPPETVNSAVVERASQLLEQLRLLNQTFLSQYAA